MKTDSKSFLLQYTSLRKIGSGLTSTVFYGQDADKKELCLKVIDPNFYTKTIGKRLIDNQIKVLKQLKHKNILSLKHHHQNQIENIIVTNYCEGGSLYALAKKTKKFSEIQTIKITKGLVTALQQLFNKRIIHRDLKPENIFFAGGEPIIADFGFAVHLDDKQLLKINAGSPLYMAPEALKSLDFSVDSQIFSLGVIMYQMLRGKTPWTASSERQLLVNMEKVKPTLQLKNKQLQKLILKCLEPKKSQRIKFEQIKSLLSAEQSIIPLPSRSIVLNDKTNKQKKEQKTQKVQKPAGKTTYKIPLKTNKKQNKENENSLTVELNKTYRFSTDLNKVKHERTSSFTVYDGAKTKRNKSQKLEKDFKIVVTRLNPQQMKFLPHSMIEKFKYILLCYEKVLQRKQISSKDLPHDLKHDKMLLEMGKCKEQRDFCQTVAAYIGRMYRLAKNYKVYREFVNDIQILYNRMQSFCA